MQIKKQQQTIIMITIVVIVMIGFALFVKESIYRHKEVRKNGYPINQREQDQTPELVTTNLDTSDWKTYQNKKYGFELKYPPESNIGMEYWTDASTARDFYVDGLYVIALDKEDSKNLDDFLERKIGKDGYSVMHNFSNRKIIRVITNNNYKFSNIWFTGSKNVEMAFVETDNYYLWFTSKAVEWGTGKMTEENIALVKSVRFDN